MNKNEFLNEIRSRLTGLPEEDIQKTIDFYTEALEDRIEDGLTEDEAVEQVGTPAEISEKILMETPLPTLIKAQPIIEPKRKIKAWEVILIILGSPVWLPILIMVFALALTIVLVIISVILAIVVTIIATGIAGVFGVFGALAGIFMGSGLKGFIDLGAAFLAMGIAVLLFIPIKAGVIWFIELMGRFGAWIKMKFIKRRKNNDTDMSAS